MAVRAPGYSSPGSLDGQDHLSCAEVPDFGVARMTARCGQPATVRAPGQGGQPPDILAQYKHFLASSGIPHTDHPVASRGYLPAVGAPGQCMDRAAVSLEGA